jgi:hypothetical protein
MTGRSRLLPTQRTQYDSRPQPADLAGYPSQIPRTGQCGLGLGTFAPFQLPGTAVEWGTWPDEPAREDDPSILERST